MVQAALEREPQERSGLLEQAGLGEETRAEVESLLAYQDAAASFIETPAYKENAESLAAEQSDELRAGGRIGEYKIISLIGEGGMGAVYLAEDAALGRTVAIKIVQEGLGRGPFIRQFQRESRILAGLNHPHIARLYGAGVTAQGAPYFVMEYVPGERLEEYCDRRRLTIADRLTLFLKLCSAVAYAHQHLVIHRDLKPANIRITAEGEPKLLDFGIARLLDDQAAQDPEQTISLAGVLTPEYASPEQVQNETTTTASDVYSLGVILYQLLTGEKPYRITSRRPEEIARVVAEEKPPRPSAAASGDPKSEIRNLKFLRGDLDNIILMAMRKEPERRYASVQQFADDIRRHLDGLPVLAHRDTFAYRSRKFLQRHKAGALAASLILLTILTGLVAVAHQARIADAQRDQAQREKANAERVSAFLQNVLLLADPSWVGGSGVRGRELTTERLLEIASARAHDELADQPAVLAGVLRSVGSTYRARGEYAKGESALREARAILLDTAGEESRETIEVTYNLAQCLTQAGRFSEAGELYPKILPIMREQADRANDEDMLLLAGMLNDHAFLFRLEGQPKAAEDLLREALEFAPRWQGAGRAIVGIHLSNLGLALEDQGKLEEAEKTTRAALAELRRLPGGLRLELANALFYLGGILTAKGDLDEAERVIREGLEINRRLVGEMHPYNARGKARLASLQNARGNFAEAERLAREALAIQEAKLPADHVSLGDPLTTLGLALTRAGNAAAAEPFLRRAIALHDKVLPSDDWLVAESKLALAECFLAQGREAEAKALVTEVHAALAKRFGPSHRRTLAAAARLR